MNFPEKRRRKSPSSALSHATHSSTFTACLQCPSKMHRSQANANPVLTGTFNTTLSNTFRFDGGSNLYFGGFKRASLIFRQPSSLQYRWFGASLR
jgi:hypothetical protein